MTRLIALLRGVNVGGTGRLPMAEFRDLLTELGLAKVQTYIQSGNAVFDTDEAPETVAARISDAVEKRFGFRRPVILRGLRDFRDAVESNPFATAPDASLHVFFCSNDQGGVELSTLSDLAAKGEMFALHGRHLFLCAPAGIGFSKLAERLPKVLTGDVTARNMKTARAILELALTDL